MSGDPLSTIRAAAYERAGISEDDPKFTASTMTTLINSALRQVSADFDPFWLLASGTIAVVASTVASPTYYLTSTLTRFRKIQRIVDDEGFDVQAVGKREFGRYARNLGKPNVYLVEEGYIKLGPISTASHTYAVHYYQNEIPLASDGDQPELPVEYTDFLVCRAAKLAAIKNRDYEMVRELDKEIEDWKKRIADDLRQMKANPRIVLRDEG